MDIPSTLLRRTHAHTPGEGGVSRVQVGAGLHTVCTSRKQAGKAASLFRPSPMCAVGFGTVRHTGTPWVGSLGGGKADFGAPETIPMGSECAFAEGLDQKVDGGVPYLPSTQTANTGPVGASEGDASADGGGRYCGPGPIHDAPGET